MAYPQNVQNVDQPEAGRSVGDLTKLISEDVKALVKSEIDLAKAELVPSAKHAGVGAGLFGGAGYFAMNGVSLLFLAGALGIGKLFGAPTGWVALGFVIMAVLIFLVAGILALIGKGQFSKVKGPERAIAQAETSIQAVKGAIARGNADAKTAELERKTFRNPDRVDNLR